MRKSSLTIAACVTLLWAGVALATTTPQQQCDYARVTAWKTYLSCVDTVVAKDAKGVLTSFDEFAAFAKCRHTYFKNWTTFQSKASLATSTCVGNRVTDNGTTVTDNLTGLVWEKKTNDASVHDESNFYTWSTGSPYAENGTAFVNFLGDLNGAGGFAGANGWRLPTLAELQNSLKDFTCAGTGLGPKCNCGAAPCIDATFGPTRSFSYWSATSYVPSPSDAWFVDFLNGDINAGNESGSAYVRAVRGGF